MSTKIMDEDLPSHASDGLAPRRAPLRGRNYSNRPRRNNYGRATFDFRANFRQVLGIGAGQTLAISAITPRR